MDAEPYICINLGTGTLDEARNWVEYCNGTGNTHYANLRRQNGHPEPYRVKYWGKDRRLRGPGPFPYLDVSATLAEAGDTLMLAVINRHRKAALTAEIDLGGWQPVSPATAYTVNADDVDATNDFGREPVGVVESKVDVDGHFTYQFPAHSLTMMTLRR